MNAIAPVHEYGTLEVEVLEYAVPETPAQLRDAVADAIWTTETRQRLVLGVPQFQFTRRAARPDEVADRRAKGMYGDMLFRPMDVVLVLVVSRPGPPLPPAPPPPADANGRGHAGTSARKEG